MGAFGLNRKIHTRLILCSALFLVFALAIPASLYPQGTSQAAGGSIDVSTADDGYVVVTHPGEMYGRIKAVVQKGTQRYNYDIRQDKGTEPLPLQMGNGAYSIMLMQNTVGDLYREISRTNVNLDMENENDVYLASVQNVNWEASEKLPALCERLTADLETDEQRIQALFHYVTRNFTYDYAKMRAVTAGYLPDIDDILEAKSGICYDFSCVFAGMLRYLNIPAKLVTGYVGPERAYHSWNSVFDGEKWNLYDPTYAITSGMRRAIKKSTTYEIKYEY